MIFLFSSFLVCFLFKKACKVSVVSYKSSATKQVKAYDEYT